MGNRDTNYQQVDITEETILDDNYESVVVSEHDESKYNFYGNDDVVQEIFDTDIDQSDDIWHYNAVRYLIYCWNQLREQFSNCPDQKKKTLWQLISRRMVEHGFYFDVIACESKWRSLKKMYMYNKTRSAKKDGSKQHIIVWDHYNDMDKAIKGIPYEISDIEDNELRDCTSDNYIITVKKNENENSIRGKNVDKILWTTDSTRELIQLYSKNIKLFSAVNQGSKHLLWEKIAQQLSQLGHQYSATLCNDKWRNLKMTYKKNRAKALKYGVEYVKWIYYKDMDDIFTISSRESPEPIDNVITVSINELGVKKENSDDLIEFSKSNINDIKDKEHTDDIDNNDNNYEGESTLGTQEIWTEKATKCLIDLWGHYRSRFMMSAQGKKRLLWNEISEQLRLNGHNYSGVLCDRKWRLLKANYMKRKEKYKKTGVHNITWQYYYDLDRLLGTPVENISWSMDSTMSLIECFDHHKEKFMKAATGGKLLIWKNISEEMAQNGFNYSPRACDNKWRTLKNRYNKNRMRANRNKKVVWVYYNKIDSVIREIDKEKNFKVNGTNNYDINSQMCDELDEHNYIRTPKPDCSSKTNAITELKDRFQFKDAEYDQRIRKMEEMLENREKKFEELHQQTLEAINRSNELEVHKIKLLEQLLSRLPHTL